MTSSPIEYITELEIKWNELDRMPNEQKAFFALICMAQNDIATFSRLVVLSNWEPTRSENINIIAAIQTNSLLRIWSAKLFEFAKMIDEVGEKEKVKDSNLREFARGYFHLFEKIESLPGFHLAKMIRNKAASHYAFRDVLKSLKNIDATAKCGYLLHDLSGNSYYPFGEEVAFIGQLNRHMSGTSKEIDAAQGIRDWMTWNIEASRIAGQVLPAFSKEFVVPLVSGRRNRLRRQPYWLEAGMVGTYGKDKLPFLMRKRDE